MRFSKRAVLAAMIGGLAFLALAAAPAFAQSPPSSIPGAEKLNAAALKFLLQGDIK